MTIDNKLWQVVRVIKFISIIEFFFFIAFKACPVTTIIYFYLKRETSFFCKFIIMSDDNSKNVLLYPNINSKEWLLSNLSVLHFNRSITISFEVIIHSPQEILIN